MDHTNGNKRFLMDVYWYEDRISLDSEFVRKVSGDKCQAEKVKALLTFDTVEMLFTASGRQFDYRLYDKLLENDLQSQADDYIENNAKDVDLGSGDTAFLDAYTWREDMQEIIDYEQVEVITWKR